MEIKRRQFIKTGVYSLLAFIFLPISRLSSATPELIKKDIPNTMFEVGDIVNLDSYSYNGCVEISSIENDGTMCFKGVDRPNTSGSFTGGLWKFKVK